MEGEAVAGGLARGGEEALVGDLDGELGAGQARDPAFAVPRGHGYGQVRGMEVLLGLDVHGGEGQGHHRGHPEAAVLF